LLFANVARYLRQAAKMAGKKERLMLLGGAVMQQFAFSLSAMLSGCLSKLN
jgi:hypothetical protein